MSERKQQLSELLDNELNVSEIDGFLNDLKRDPLADGETLQHYQLIADAMKDEISDASFLDISGAVMHAIDAEPPLVPAKPVKRRSSRFDWSNWTRPVAGMAVAASVAVVTVVTLRGIQPEVASNQPLIAQTSEVMPAPVALQPEVARNIRVASTDQPPVNNNGSAALREYMMNHSEYAGQATMQGVMPYARVVSFGQYQEHSQ